MGSDTGRDGLRSLGPIPITSLNGLHTERVPQHRSGAGGLLTGMYRYCPGTGTVPVSSYQQAGHAQQPQTRAEGRSGKTAQQPRRRLRWHRDPCRTMLSWKTLSHLSQCQEVARYPRDSRVVAKWITTSPPSHSKLAQPLNTCRFRQWRP